MPPKSTTANSGIRKLSTGESVIPSSTRADGSVRKEIRVKPGYKPPEDVEVYKNRTAEAWKTRGKGGVPGVEPVAETAPSAAANKNAKRREARKKAAAAAAEGKAAPDGEDGEAAAVVGHDATEKMNGDAVVSKQENDRDAEKAKEARKLAKKLRQARELKEKKEAGGSLLPEQLEKATKINELVRQLDSLGFDAEGEKKSEDVVTNGTG
jgi:partner of Y14 and mago protein